MSSPNIVCGERHIGDRPAGNEKACALVGDAILNANGFTSFGQNVTREVYEQQTFESSIQPAPRGQRCRRFRSPVPKMDTDGAKMAIATLEEAFSIAS